MKREKFEALMECVRTEARMAVYECNEWSDYRVALDRDRARNEFIEKYCTPSVRKNPRRPLEKSVKKKFVPFRSI